MNLIVGSGLAGLLTAHVFPSADIIEAASEPIQMHNALLRFRSLAVSELTGIDFRTVTVRKGIWSNGGFVEPNIAAANNYAYKCLGKVVGDRSIWNLDVCQRYIAPDNFYWQLIDRLRNRISYGEAFAFDRPAISTAPLPIALAALGIETDIYFKRAPIHVARFMVADCDAHQTIYFPDLSTPLYRGSITGNLLILEFVSEHTEADVTMALKAFGIIDCDVTALCNVSQRFGKIGNIDAAARKKLIGQLTEEHGIYSVGRFACWRNILLDDVVKDARQVKRLSGLSQYERKIKRTEGE